MKIILRNTVTGVERKMNYPSVDITKPPSRTILVDGEKQVVNEWPENEKAYVEVISEKPTYDRRTHKITKTEEWTENNWEGHSHLFIRQIGWDVSALTTEQIAENLKNEYVRFRDESYPMDRRLADSDQRILILALKSASQSYDTDEETRQWLIGNWQTTIRDEYYAQKTALIDNGTLPSFTFSLFPV